jgi:cytochrome c5
MTAICKTSLGAIGLAMLAALGLAVGAANPQPTTVTAAGVTLTSVSVTLPGSAGVFPAGPGAMQTNANCLTCHSAGMVLNQPNFPKATWQAIVKQMITQFQAPIAATDVQPIVDYLTSIKGKS